MKVILCLALFAFSLSYALNIEEKAAFDNLLEGFGSPNEEEARQKQCILRTHECTNNRHGCCRGEYMKDDCTCFTLRNGSQSQGRRSVLLPATVVK
uniref:U35-Austrotoxin-Ht1p_1 n=1 Tax=Hickmania troglodytes TaxID=489260 RepID=A0A482ZG95_9ARAC